MAQAASRVSRSALLAALVSKIVYKDGGLDSHGLKIYLLRKISMSFSG